MPDQNPHLIARVSHRSFHSLFTPFPTVCFTGALATDLIYWKTAEMMWADASAWLLAIGISFGILAAIAALVDLFAKRISIEGPLTLYLACSAVILVLSVFNSLVHSRDAWTSVVPEGLILSSIVVILILVAAWINWTLLYRRTAGMSHER
jgi:uncharacterized membrane protein